jgi:hypothetical protein
MWGYFMEEAMLAQWKGVEFDEYSCDDGYWFDAGVFARLYKDDGLLISDIYKCLTKSCINKYNLKVSLVDRFPNKKNEIKDAFN